MTCGQSYKASTIVIYDPRVVIYERKMFIRLATGGPSSQRIRVRFLTIIKFKLTTSELSIKTIRSPNFREMLKTKYIVPLGTI